ncbi:potassium-transporting ATPase subunit KdpC [Nitrosomonas sp. Nm34]|uniref:potassium-transporting ATPase subunit KdpC n=1 Tax=Nitrosomonas sp. Nm34 TaxID=1881055 RepID=UPI000B843654|nr:potassium-transporting ATPase subunit KdpC [Nitrosomonas sp. Nm34]
MKNLIRPAITLFILISLVTGLLYPLAVTGIAQIAFPEQAAGSLLKRGDEMIGSILIGQNFSEPTFFWSRPSATSPMPYNAANSGGSNLGPTNPALIKSVSERIQKLRASHPGKEDKIPTDLVTTSASGLDPHISPAAAYYQVERVAAARGIDVATVQSLVDRSIETPQWGIWGDSRVNVLRLNLALEELQK